MLDKNPEVYYYYKKGSFWNDSQIQKTSFRLPYITNNYSQEGLEKAVDNVNTYWPAYHNNFRFSIKEMKQLNLANY